MSKFICCYNFDCFLQISQQQENWTPMAAPAVAPLRAVSNFFFGFGSAAKPMAPPITAPVIIVAAVYLQLGQI